MLRPVGSYHWWCRRAEKWQSPLVSQQARRTPLASSSVALLAGVLAGWLALPTTALHAQAALASPAATAPTARATRAPVTLAQLEQQVGAGSTPEALGALDALLARKQADAGRTLAALISRGLPSTQLEHLLLALTKAPRADLLPAISALRSHRGARVRAQAYAALAALALGGASELKGASSRRELGALLARGLRDPEPEVRGVCASTLGQLAATEHAELLLRAFELGVPEAGSASGRVVPPEQLGRLHAQLGTLPLAVLLDAYRAVIERKDVPERDKLEVVAKLGELPSPAVKHFLGGLLADRLIARGSQLEHAVRETHKRIAAPDPQSSAAPPARPNGPAGGGGTP